MLTRAGLVPVGSIPARVRYQGQTSQMARGTRKASATPAQGVQRVPAGSRRWRFRSGRTHIHGEPDWNSEMRGSDLGSSPLMPGPRGLGTFPSQTLGNTA